MGLWAKKYHRSVRKVAMVLAAAIALGSSTYAWFVTNTQVTAEKVDIYVWMEGCDGDTIAGNISSFSVQNFLSGVMAQKVFLP